jgi:hypothetical protein
VTGEGPTLWDEDESKKARDEGILTVQALSTPWRTVAFEALRDVARRDPGGLVTSEDVWRELDAWEVARPIEPRAMGPVMQQGVREGLLRATTTFINSTAVSRHAAPIRAYRVLG